MTFHLQESLDLADGEVLPVSQSDELVESTKQFVGILDNLPLIQALASAGNDLGEEVKGVDVLEDVGLAVGNEDYVQFVERLVDEANVVLFDCGVLSATIRELWEGGQEGFDTGPRHLAELSRENSFAPAGADGRCEDNLEGVRSERFRFGIAVRRRNLTILTMSGAVKSPLLDVGCQNVKKSKVLVSQAQAQRAS